ncbi:calcium-activated chloride channel-domain-containing protein [Ochromonadaceae sp. CCMP2298]|nr:calcium-activated chloride channel-domain-containing protein [Ochromonadaceae sp. CCMP2298]
MALWSVFFLEHWKRTENNTSMKWGMTGFEKQEQVRVQFQGETILSPVDGKPELYFPTGVRKRRQYWSSAVINSMCLIVVGVVACIFALRIAIRTTNAELGGVQLASVVASVLLALQVQILNGYFGNVALELNQAENHRTDTEFEDSLISKTFSFQFVNSYAALFYIAFLKPFLPSIDPCLNSNCLEELQTTLGTIFLMRVTIGNITELGLPMLTAYYNNRQLKRAEARRMEAAGVTDLQNSELSEVESAFLMPHYDVMLGTFDDFAEMVIQFGYTTMFVAAFPLATVLSFVNNYVEIRVDAWKLCQLMRRAEPRSAEDIGTWQSILEFISTAAIIVNSGLVAFTATNMEDSTWTLRSWTFLLMTAGLMAMRTIVAMLIPDEPEWVGIQLKRQEYINGKVLDNIEDEDDSALLNKTGYQVPNFLIDGTDVDPM